MKATVLVPALMAGMLALAPARVIAANADNPYGNVDHRNDQGNDTGDAKIDGLNAGQLNQNYRGPWEARTPSQQPGTSVVIQSAPPAVQR